jgi:serine/threonine protein kinase
MLLAGPYARPEELERFLREAEAVAGLRHANIVQVHDKGDLDGRPYFTLESVEGGNLAQKLSGTPQPAAQAAALVATLAEAIVVQTKAERLGMYLMGQAFFSAKLMKRFRASSAPASAKKLHTIPQTRRQTIATVTSKKFTRHVALPGRDCFPVRRLAVGRMVLKLRF